jgi:hypothetical protein
MINPWEAITQGSKGFGNSQITSWELYEIYTNPAALSRTSFYYQNKLIANPFK